MDLNWTSMTLYVKQLCMSTNCNWDSTCCLAPQKRFQKQLHQAALDSWQIPATHSHNVMPADASSAWSTPKLKYQVSCRHSLDDDMLLCCDSNAEVCMHMLDKTVSCLTSAPLCYYVAMLIFSVSIQF